MTAHGIGLLIEVQSKTAKGTPGAGSWKRGQQRWRCRNYQDLHQAEWEGEYFIFNPASGDTHLLNPVSMELLQLLSREAVDLKQAEQYLRSLLNDDQAPPSLHLLEEHLMQLDLMGLIIPVTQ